MLPDETVISASKSFIEVGVVGTVALLAIVALHLVTKSLFEAQDKLIAAANSQAGLMKRRRNRKERGRA